MGKAAVLGASKVLHPCEGYDPKVQVTCRCGAVVGVRHGKPNRHSIPSLKPLPGWCPEGA